MSLRLFSSFIIKTKNPCIKCVNYIPPIYYDPYYDSMSNNLGTCSLFGKHCVVTGEIEYNVAKVCRIDTSKCGQDGKYYVEVKK